MKNAFLINAHQEYPFSPGKLNASLLSHIEKELSSKGFEIKSTDMKMEYNIEEEIQKHLWSDVIILQSPVNWMGVPWSFKKYLDEVYTAGMRGQLCKGDGRSSKSPKQGYGTGGSLTGKKYMMSLTFNAPKEAFNNSEEWLFQGKSADDLFFPMHMNFRFFGLEQIETFVCYDVMKNPSIEQDFTRLSQHINTHIKGALNDK